MVDIEHFLELDDGVGCDLRDHNLKVTVQRSRLQLLQGFFTQSCLRMEQFTIFCRRSFVCEHFQEEAGRLESGCGFLKYQLLVHYICKLQVTR